MLFSCKMVSHRMTYLCIFCNICVLGTIEMQLVPYQSLESKTYVNSIIFVKAT